MPRKLFRKYLPTHASIHGNRFIAMFGSLLTHHNLWHLHRRSVAGGVAIGLFTGLIPGPLQILTGTILAVAFRVNLPVMVLATFYTNPFTIVPLYYVAYRLGRLATWSDHSPGPPAPPDLGGMSWAESPAALWTWMSSLGKPLAIGLPLLATILAALGYLAVLGSWRLYVIVQWRRRRHRVGRP